jgi:hypothetical protein
LKNVFDTVSGAVNAFRSMPNLLFALSFFVLNFPLPVVGMNNAARDVNSTLGVTLGTLALATAATAATAATGFVAPKFTTTTTNDGQQHATTEPSSLRTLCAPATMECKSCQSRGQRRRRRGLGLI